MKLKIRNKRVFNFYLLQLLGWGLVFVYNLREINTNLFSIYGLGQDFAFSFWYCFTGFLFTILLRYIIKTTKLMEKDILVILSSISIITIISTILWLLTVINTTELFYKTKNSFLIRISNNNVLFLFTYELFIWTALYFLIRKYLENKKLTVELKRVENNIRTLNTNFRICKYEPTLIFTTLKSVLSTVNIDLHKAKEFITMFAGFVYKSNNEKLVSNNYKQVVSYVKILERFFEGRFVCRIRKHKIFDEKLFCSVPFHYIIGNILNYALENNYQNINLDIDLKNEESTFLILFSLEANRLDKMFSFKEFLYPGLARIINSNLQYHYCYEFISDENKFSIVLRINDLELL